MARLPRYYVPHQPLHLIQRGNNRNPIFVAGPDYLFYLQCLYDAAKQHACDIHAYVLMTNHVHLLVTPHHPDTLAKMFQSIGRRYVQYFNFTYQRTGTLWEGRYRATLIDTEHYLLRCHRYIEWNPVRAKMVTHPREYRWSSYRHHAEGKTDRLITDHALYLALGKTGTERQRGYRGLSKAELEEESVAAIREATNKA